MKSSTGSLEQRGFINEHFTAGFEHFDTRALCDLLENSDPQKRTAAAVILGKQKEPPAILPLCRALQKEKKLYSKIAISEALSAMGTPAIPELVKLLGKTGTNQHRSLPKKPFNKKNYPLPRDMAARTLIRIGPAALGPLEEVIRRGEPGQVSEAIDAFGFITFYHKTSQSPDVLFECLEKNTSFDLITWKIIRAFQSFPSDRVIHYLENILKSPVKKEFLWEAERSLKQIKGGC